MPIYPRDCTWPYCFCLKQFCDIEKRAEPNEHPRCPNCPDYALCSRKGKCDRDGGLSI